MKIFRVTVTYETVIRAKSASDAEESANRVIRDSDEDPQEVNAIYITKLSELPDGWDQNCLPWETGRANGDIALGAMLSSENAQVEARSPEKRS